VEAAARVPNATPSGTSSRLAGYLDAAIAALFFTLRPANPSPKTNSGEDSNGKPAGSFFCGPPVWFFANKPPERAATMRRET